MVMGLTALGLLLALQQQASAWSKFKFGIGFNISWEGSDNSILFGLFKGGPSPNQGTDGNYSQGGYPNGYAGGYPGGYAGGYGNQGLPSQHSPGMTPEGFAGPPSPSAQQGQLGMAKPVAYFPNQPASMISYQAASTNPNWDPYYGQSGAAGASWNQAGRAPSYWYPGATQAPSYWYYW